MSVTVRIDYTNWRGERAERFIHPQRVFFGVTKFHTTPQWFLVALDVEKGADRSFAMKDIHSWTPVTSEKEE